MSLFVGRLDLDCRREDLEDLFHKYGTISRCDVKKGYGFVVFEDKRDAEDALKACDGATLKGSRIVVEWSKGTATAPRQRTNECFKCGREGHWARDCPDAGEGGAPAAGGPMRSRSRSRSPRRRSPDRRSYRRRSYSRSRSPVYSSSRRRGGSRSPAISPRRRSISPRRRSSRSPPVSRYGGSSRYAGAGGAGPSRRSPPPRRFSPRRSALGGSSSRRSPSPPSVPQRNSLGSGTGSGSTSSFGGASAPVPMDSSNDIYASSAASAAGSEEPSVSKEGW